MHQDFKYINIFFLFFLGFSSKSELENPNFKVENSNKQDVKNIISSSEYIKGENLNYVYLQTKISEFPTFESILITVETRDQGWSTVQGSNSFFDLRVLDEKGNMLAERKRIIENSGEENYKFKKFTLNKNDEILGNYLNGNNILQLVVRSQFAGWENYIKFAEFKFE